MKQTKNKIMLNNLTNFFNLITGKMIKKKPENSDLLILGTKDSRYDGGYKPTAITYEDFKSDMVTVADPECTKKFGLNYNSVGPKVSFRKPNHQSGIKDVIIEDALIFARANNQGIYNSYNESGYDIGVSPLDTEWNSEFTDPVNYGWGNLGQVGFRTFDTFTNALDNAIGANIVGKELVFRHTPTGRMWIIKFTEWTQGGNGGGFAYDRYEIFPQTQFYRPTQEPLIVDKISEGLIIKRDNNRGIYNAVLEDQYDDNGNTSPKGTEWNSIYTDSSNYGWHNLSQVRNRKFGTWREAVDANPPASVSDGLELVMHDLSTDLYWTVIFTAWGQNGNNGEVGYTRQLIPLDCGIIFNDGTSLTTADLGSSTTCCYTDAENNMIGIDNANNTVNVPAQGSHNIPNFSGILIVNDHFNGGIEVWLCGGGPATVLISSTIYGPGPGDVVIEGTINGYVWKNAHDQIGPFTFTVIRTRDTA